MSKMVRDLGYVERMPEGSFAIWTPRAKQALMHGRHPHVTAILKQNPKCRQPFEGPSIINVVLSEVKHHICEV